MRGGADRDEGGGGRRQREGKGEVMEEEKGGDSVRGRGEETDGEGDRKRK